MVDNYNEAIQHSNEWNEKYDINHITKHFDMTTYRSILKKLKKQWCNHSWDIEIHKFKPKGVTWAALGVTGFWNGEHRKQLCFILLARSKEVLPAGQ